MDALRLVEAAEISEDCSKAAVAVFQQKFNENEFFPLENSAYLQQETKLIKHFGHLIKKLSINIGPEVCEQNRMHEAEYLLEAINTHCRESLVEFKLNYTGCNTNHVLQKLTGPFERVELLLIDLNDMIETNVILCQVFPNIRELEIIYFNLDYPSFAYCKFPQLKRLGIDNRYTKKDKESILLDVFKNNPQISYLSMISPTTKLFRLVKDNLKGLEDLHLTMQSKIETNWFSWFTQDVKFKSVRRVMLTYGEHDCKLPKHIKFNKFKLQEITLLCTAGDENEDFLNFIVKYKKLRKLSAGNALNNTHLSSLTGKVEKLSEAFFDFHKNVEVKNIIAFVQKAAFLNRLEFIHQDIANVNDFENQLKAELGADFNIQHFDIPGSLTSKRFIIQRKVPIVVEEDNYSNGATSLYHSIVMFMAAYAASFLLL